jgi:GNAT superfamily N-acetyltransferase
MPAHDTVPATAVDGLSTREPAAAHAPLLQRFFDDDLPASSRRPARRTRSRNSTACRPPAGVHEEMGSGWSDADGRLAAMAEAIGDLLAPGVRHVGLFIVATSRRGRGDAQALVGEPEARARGKGAQWLRLDVVAGNTRAERFRAARGLVAMRTRGGCRTGPRDNL